MDLFTPLLVSLCVSTPGAYNTACQKATEATYVQSGWAAEMNTFQNGLERYGASRERAIFGGNTATVNSFVVVGVAIKTKKAKLNLPNLGLCDHFSTEIQPNSYGLKWEWRW